MTRTLARACRWLAGRLLALAERLDPAPKPSPYVLGREAGAMLRDAIDAFASWSLGVAEGARQEDES